MTDTPQLDALTEQALAAAKAAGADSADTLAVRGTSLSIDVRGGKLEHADRSESVELGLRVFMGQRSAVVATSEVSPTTIQGMAERAVAMAREAPEDPDTGLADAPLLAQTWDVEALDLIDPMPDPSPDHLLTEACEIEAAAAAVPGVSQVDSCSTGYGHKALHLATSNGFSGGYARTGHMRSCVAISGEGTEMERDYDGGNRSHYADQRSTSEIGRTAGQRAVERTGATRPKTGHYPVLFDERISGSLIGHMLSAINGAAVARGSSWLKDALGDQVLPKGMSLMEEPHRPRISGSRPFDGEGLPTQGRSIVEDGILQSYILDLASARKLGLTPTGHAGRGTGGAPSPTIGNLRLTQGEATREELIAQMGTGLIVTSMIGATINPNTGDYSRGASGFWVENGEIQGPVTELTIAGSLPEMLRNVIPANDARGYLSRVIPSLLVEGLTIAGD